MNFGCDLTPALSIEETTQKPLPYLPEELWLEIFARASAGTLWNTRQVSRAWRRLTDHTVRFDILPSVTILSPDQPPSSRLMWGVFHGVSSTGFSENHDGGGRNETIANRSATANISRAYFTLRTPLQKRRIAASVITTLLHLYPMREWPDIAVVNTADDTLIGHITEVMFCYTAPPRRNDAKLRTVSARRSCFSHIAAPLVACMRWLRGDRFGGEDEQVPLDEMVVFVGQAVRVTSCNGRMGAPHVLFWEVRMWEHYMLVMLCAMWKRERGWTWNWRAWWLRLGRRLSSG